MSNNTITSPDENVVVTARPPSNVRVISTQPTVRIGSGGLPGPPGPPGPQGSSGTMVVAIPYDEWPPADPQANTLYLRLAP